MDVKQHLKLYVGGARDHYAKQRIRIQHKLQASAYDIVPPTTATAGYDMGLLVTQTYKGSNERLFILTRTHSMQIFGEIPFIKPQNDT